MSMSRMTDWFADWVEEHRARHPGAFLPDPSTDDGREHYATWLVNLRRRGVMDRDVLTLASQYLAGEVLKSPRDHLPTLIKLAVDIYKQRQVETGAAETSDPNSRETAERESRGCLGCGGIGLATVWSSRPDPIDRQCNTTAGYCDDCAMGRWLELSHRNKSTDVRKRIRWRSELLRLGWLDMPPGIDPAAVDGHRHFTPSELIREWTNAAKTEPRVISRAPAPQPRDVRNVRDHDRILDPPIQPAPPDESISDLP